MMRVAISIGMLRVPPTYFAIEHASVLANDDDVQIFARAARITAPIPVEVKVPPLSSPYGMVGRAMAFLGGVVTFFQIVRFKPDVIQHHFGTWAGPAQWASRATGAPLFITLHGYDVFQALPREGVHTRATLRARRRFGRLARRGAHFLPVSDYLRGRAIEAGIPASRLTTLRLGVDTDYFSPRGRLEQNTSRGARRVLVVSSLTPHKGIDHTINALARSSMAEGVELVVLGEGPLRGHLEEMAASLGVPGQFLGNVPRDEVRGHIHAADVLVLTSHEHEGWQEAAGLVLLEAQSCGLPVVTYRGGGRAEMVEDGRGGYIVAEGDIRALGACISKVLSMSDDDYRTLSEQARSFAVDHRNARTAARRLRGLFRDAISSRSED